MYRVHIRTLMYMSKSYEPWYHQHWLQQHNAWHVYVCIYEPSPRVQSYILMRLYEYVIKRVSLSVHQSIYAQLSYTVGMLHIKNYTSCIVILSSLPEKWFCNFESFRHMTSRVSVAQLVRARDCWSLGRRFDSVENPRTQIPMDLNYIDTQSRVVDYCWK